MEQGDLPHSVNLRDLQDKLANVGAGPVGRPKKTGRHELKD